MAQNQSRARVALLMVAVLLLCLRVDFLRFTVLPLITAFLGLMGAREVHRFGRHIGVTFSLPLAMVLSAGIVLMGMADREVYVQLLPVALTGSMIGIFTVQMNRYGIPGALTGVASSLLVLAYVAIPLSLALQVMQYDRLFLFFGLGLIWMADSGAYFVGRKWGKRKMAPNLSPKKTIEGLLGGVATCCLVAVLFKILVSDVSFPYPLIHIVPLAALIGFAAPVGDLAESVLKRDSGVKDSGHSLGGHGGVLDRIDSMLFCMPIYYAYLRFFVWPELG